MTPGDRKDINRRYNKEDLVSVYMFLSHHECFWNIYFKPSMSGFPACILWSSICDRNERNITLNTSTYNIKTKLTDELINDEQIISYTL